MHGRIFKGALSGFTGSHYGTQGSIGYPRIRDAEGCTFHIGSYNLKKKKKKTERKRKGKAKQSEHVEEEKELEELVQEEHPHNNFVGEEQKKEEKEYKDEEGGKPSYWSLGRWNKRDWEE